MDHKVVFTDHTFDALDIEREVFAEADVDIELVDGERRDEPLEDVAADADGLLVMYEEIDEELIDRMTECRVISRTGIGVDNVDVDAATERGTYVTNVTDYCIDEVSDHTIAFMLALQRKLVFYNDQTRAGGWDVTAGRPMTRLGEQALGLVAFGNIACEVGRKASALGMDVLAWDPYLDDAEIEEGGATPIDDLEELLARSDVVSVHPPLTPETEGLLSTNEFEAMKDSAFVLNVARGGIVDESALADALEAGEVAGAGIDVLAEEPPSDSHPLVDRDDAILTPHAAWNSTQSVRELREKAAMNVRTALEGDVPPYLYNDSVLE